MSAVNDQLRNFEKTGIKGDGRTAAELGFEEELKVSLAISFSAAVGIDRNKSATPIFSETAVDWKHVQTNKKSEAVGLMVHIQGVHVCYIFRYTEAPTSGEPS